MRRLFRILYGILVLVCAVVLAAVGYYRFALPDRFTVSQGRQFCIGWLVQSDPLTPSGGDRAASATVGDEYRARLSLAGLFPLKDVTVSVSDKRVVMVCGTPFGIKMYMDGVLVIGLSDVTTAAGNVNPAAAAGVCVGDTIQAVNGKTVSTSRQVSAAINDCGGKPVTLRLCRDGVEFDAAFTPVRPVGETGYRGGMWVRDSAAGVGTLTFYDPQSGAFGGLGHAVFDADTGQETPLGSGEIVPARIFDVTKGEAGNPGELKGSFEPGTLGELLQNGQDGLYGRLTMYPIGRTLPVAPRQQVHKGAAQLLTTVNGTEPQVYEVQIEQIRYGGMNAIRNMVVRVTDPRLLDKAGGIVQGMSGSPLIQDGHLVGAITHVLVDDPTRGYAIFAETMLQTADEVAAHDPAA